MEAKQYASEYPTYDRRNKKIKICIETNKNENTTTQNLWNLVQSSAKRRVHSNSSLPHETRETSHKQPKFILEATRKIEEPQSNK